MEEIRLKDICDLDNGYAFKSDDYVESSNTLNCRMSNIRPDGSFDILYSAKYLPDEFVKKYKNYVLNDGDLIIAMTDMAGDPKILGVPTVVDTKGYKLLLNQRVGRLRFIRDGINADYLKFALQCKRVRDYLKMFAGGGVQLNVSKKDILNAPIRMRAIGEQQSIADLLKRIIKLQKLREQELQHFDNLIKARFVEMFGDVNANDRKWPIKPLGELCNIVRGASPRPIEKFLGGTVPWIKIGDATENESVYLNSTKEHIIENGVKKSRLVKSGSLIFANCGVSLGFARIITFDGCIHDGWLAMEDIDQKLDKVFLLHTLNQVTEHFRKVAPAGTQPNLNTAIMKSYKQILPPLELQRTFIEFAKQVDKSKVAIQKSLAETQLLFDKLMQDYFG